MARLEAKMGDRLAIGAARFEIRAVLRAEPDKLAGGVGFGSRVLVSFDALKATGLVQPGTIVRYIARLALPGGPSDDDVARFADAAGAAFPKAGWDIRKRDAVSPQFTRNLERFSQLLTLVALTALVAGGAGVANAVQGLIERKRAAFAILKALGAPASRVFAIALTQVLLMATLAICARPSDWRRDSLCRRRGAAPRDRTARRCAGRLSRPRARRALWSAGHTGVFAGAAGPRA